MNRFYDEIDNDRIENFAIENIDAEIYQEGKTEKCFLWNQNKIETLPEIEERLHELGIENVDLKGTKEIWQKKIMSSVETMFESHPELKGCLGSIRTAKLDDGVYACAGPRMTEHGIS